MWTPVCSAQCRETLLAVPHPRSGGLTLELPLCSTCLLPFSVPGDHSNEHLALEHHLTVCQSETATILKVITVVLFVIFNF